MKKTTTDEKRKRGIERLRGFSVVIGKKLQCEGQSKLDDELLLVIIVN